MLKTINFSLLFVLLTKAFAIEPLPLTEDESRALLEVITNQSYSSLDAKRTAFETLRSRSSRTEPHFISYCNTEEINLIKEISSDIYAEIVKSMTISCVDAFVYDFENRTYLMIQRTTSPVKGKWWIPGGRIFKGESFYEAAIRKTKKESGLDVCPVAQLGTYSTYFSESAWGSDVHTDTKNTAILTLCNNQSVLFDEHHQAFKWVPINQAPDDPYILAVYKEAKAKLAEMGFTNLEMF